MVCEASSFQLEDTCAFAPEVAVLLNLEPDHLDRHGTYDAYVAAKLRIFANQGNDDVAVAPDDLDVEDLGGCARRVRFGAGPGAELSVRAGHLWWEEEPLLADAARSRCPASTTAPTRWPPRRHAWLAASTATRWRPGCAPSRASRTGSS